MKNVSRAVLLMFFAALISPAAAANLTGVVRDASGEIATVETAGDVLPAVGDKVEIFFELAGTEVSVATGHVQEVAPGKVVVKIENATGTVEANLRARFTSKTSQKPSGLSGPASSPTSSQPKSAASPMTTGTPPAKFSDPSSSTKPSPPPSTKLQTPAPKAPPPPPNDGPDDAVPGSHYAAIAYSPTTGKWGSARNYKSKNAAIARARSECGQNDASIAWCRDAWVALAISDKQPGGSGSAWGVTANAARQTAKRECLKRASDARVVLCISASGK